jgi:MscS family membrane protein
VETTLSFFDWLSAEVPALLDGRVLSVALWKWLALLTLVVVAYAASWLAAALIVRLLRPLVRRSRTLLDEQLLDVSVGPLRLGVAVAVFAAGTLVLPLAPSVRVLLLALERTAVMLAVTWLLLRAIDIVAGAARTGLAAGGRESAAAMVPVGGKAAKVTVLGLAVLGVLQNTGVNITGILAGLGIGGLAIALAAQKTVENVFGGVTLILDQPVRVGDFCRFGERVGTVEEIGLRSTRVRTLDRTVVAVPNAEFATLHLENFTSRDRIWLKATLGLRYETTPDQLRHALVEIRSMLYAHPRIDPTAARVRFVGFGAHSLDLEIFAYVLTTSYDEFLAVQEDVYLRIIDVVAASGTGFAFPSQTLYLASDGGLDRARTQDAEARVRGWRERGELLLPEFPPERVTALRASLDYPPNGAAVARER